MLGTALAIGGALLGGGLNMMGQNYANKAAMKHDKKMRIMENEFSKEKMQNALQWQMQDAKAAGLNANLLYANGGNASMAGQSGGSAIQPANPVESAINSALTIAEIKKKDAEAQNIKAQTEETKQTIQWTPELNKSLINLQKAQTDKTKQEEIESIAKTLAIQFQNKMAEMDVMKRTNQYDKELETYKNEIESQLKETGLNNSYTQKIIDKTLNRIGKTAGAIIGMSALNNLLKPQRKIGF